MQFDQTDLKLRSSSAEERVDRPLENCERDMLKITINLVAAVYVTATSTVLFGLCRSASTSRHQCGT